VGIYNRDYYRETSFAESIPQVCKWLIIANVVVFLLQIFITRPTTPKDLQALIERERPPAAKNRKTDTKPDADRDAAPSRSAEPSATSAKRDAMKQKSASKTSADSKSPRDEKAKPSDKEIPSDTEDQEDQEALAAAMLPSVSVVQEWFELDAYKVVRQGQVWRLLTYAFCHDRFGVWHIVFNMLFLYYFGRMLEPLYGSREFLIFYMTAAVVSGLCYMGLCLFTHQATPAIGASGAVMAVVVLYAIHHPREKICVFMLFPIEIRWLVLIYLIYDLHPVLLALSGTPMYTGVANAAHLGGAAFGYLYWRWGGRLEDIWDRASRRGRLARARLSGNMRLYRPIEDADRDELDTLVDGILEKIHKHGRESLSPRERAALNAAAEKYKEKGKA
jgi:membrane associated rhomboid family serine protease